MTLEDLQLKLSILANSGMEDNHSDLTISGKEHVFPKIRLVKLKKRHSKKESNVQLNLFE